MVSYRLGGTDGVSIEAAKWVWALQRLGWKVYTVAGEGNADHIVPELAMDSKSTPSRQTWQDTLDPADLVVVENVCSLPLNPASRSLGRFLTGRPALLHHHDLPWECPGYPEDARPPDGPTFLHVCLTDLARQRLRARGIEATVIHNHFVVPTEAPDPAAARVHLGIPDDARLVLQPTRAIERKNIPGGLQLAEELGAIYWIMGPAEEGYDTKLTEVLAAARTSVRYGRPPGVSSTSQASDEISSLNAELIQMAYAAADLVCLPSTNEGFGNPAVEGLLWRRPVAVGPYESATELARCYGLNFLDIGQPDLIRRLLDDDGARQDWVERGFQRARALDLDLLPDRIAAILEQP
jgi:glycosyltransferase involved in cell wall biosynthesis